mmetsp:Transcript_18068/g.32564  ORF Transcript_18068/g.32564 Transcript_18068/m.32564 type:complete len:425 (+) Transcript_18068:327-1601(+)
MCVTNFVKRNPRTVVVPANQAAVSSTPSLISQRLMGNFMPLMMNAPLAKPGASVEACPGPQQQQQSAAAISNNGSVCTSEDQKSRPKRRRKPQKPGLTAKKNERHFVKHDYHDHAFDSDDSDCEEDEAGKRKPCTTQTFPMKLHSVLEQIEKDGYGDVVGWQPHGRCFCIRKTKEFVEYIMPTYFRQGKLTSFQRQLNLYGFARLTRGKDAGAYYHELFLRGKSSLVKRMKRTKIKGTKFKAASSPDMEPDFYTMPPVMAVSQVSDESSADNDSYRRSDNNSLLHPSSMDMAPVEFASSSSFDPIPLQAPCQQVVQTPMQPYPMFAATNNTNGMNPMMAAAVAPGNNNMGNSSFSRMPMTAPFSADKVLDDAVDELFKDSDPMEDNANLNNLWDANAFCDTEEVGRVQNDTELGYLLERFLQES